jgi:23S rRNA (adenine-N6)-dimethyltransferase
VIGKARGLAGPAPASRHARRTDRDQRRRTLSQNFLRDAAAASQFLQALTVDPDRLCVEVGAGDGILTERLATMCRRLVAYEVDPHLVPKLEARLGRRTGVEIMVGDFLSARPPDESFQVVGNVPFSLTSAIVDWCLRAPRLTTATIITQLEYAKKRTGAYGRWSLLTISTWPEFSWELRGSISRQNFRPVPRVDAGILHLRRRETPLLPKASRRGYLRMVELGFNGRGGNLYASLDRLHPRPQLARAFDAVGLDRQTVVAFVHPQQWLDLYTELEPRS